MISLKEYIENESSCNAKKKKKVSVENADEKENKEEK